MRNIFIKGKEMRLSRQSYVRPSIKTFSLAEGEAILAADSPDTTRNWNPNDEDDKDVIHIKDETGGNLGGEGSEITGAKQNQAWNLWD